MRTKSIYRKSDGVLTGMQISLSPWDEEKARAMLPEGHDLVDGEHDHRTRRVDVASGEVIAHTPPPDPDAARREAAYAKTRDREKAQGQIDALERSAHRAIRELAIDPSNAAARRRLALIESQIDALRARAS